DVVRPHDREREAGVPAERLAVDLGERVAGARSRQIGKRERRGLGRGDRQLEELYERLLAWMAFPALLDAGASSAVDEAAVKRISTALARHAEAAAQAGYRVDDLLALVTARARRR